MAGVSRSVSFWIGAAVVAAIVFLFGINSNRLYVGETDILVVLKSNQAVRNATQIMNNVQEIPLSLKFYDAMLKENSNINDRFAALPNYKRKTMWNSEIRVEKKGESGILRIEAQSPSQLQASIISQQTAKDIAIAMSRYYNIRTEMDIRIVDGPIVSPQSNLFDWKLIIWSLILGLLGGIASNYIYGQKKKPVYFSPRPNINFPPFSASSAPERSEVRTEIHEDVFAEPIEKKEPTIHDARKAGAPANLPVGSEFVLGALRRSAKTSKEEEEQVIEPRTHEATAEEIRARLNKLLGGKL